MLFASVKNVVRNFTLGMLMKSGESAFVRVLVLRAVGNRLYRMQCVRTVKSYFAQRLHERDIVLVSAIWQRLMVRFTTLAVMFLFIGLIIRTLASQNKCSSTALLWNRCLDAFFLLMKQCITKTVNETIIGLRIWNCGAVVNQRANAPRIS